MLGYLLRVKDVRRASALTLLSRSGLEFSCWKSAVTGTEVLKAFLKNPWPGNVRELEHTMEHAFVLCSQNIITLDHLPPDFMSAPGIEHRSPMGHRRSILTLLLKLWIRPTGTKQKQPDCWVWIA